MDSEILSHYNIRASTKSTALFHLYNLDEATLGSIELKTDEKKQAEIIIGENKYEIIQPSIWESKYSVLLNKDTVATLKINSLNLNTEIKILGKKPIEYKLEILSRSAFVFLNSKVKLENDELYVFYCLSSYI